jgi:hypothetical protein
VFYPLSYGKLVNRRLASSSVLGVEPTPDLTRPPFPHIQHPQTLTQPVYELPHGDQIHIDLWLPRCPSHSFTGSRPEPPTWDCRLWAVSASRLLGFENLSEGSPFPVELFVKLFRHEALKDPKDAKKLGLTRKSERCS